MKLPFDIRYIMSSRERLVVAMLILLILQGYTEPLERTDWDRWHLYILDEWFCRFSNLRQF